MVRIMIIRITTIVATIERRVIIAIIIATRIRRPSFFPEMKSHVSWSNW